MSTRKASIVKYQNITNGDMSLASITSTVTNIQFIDTIGLQLDWTGSSVGSFEVQVSADYAQDNQGNVTNSGTWAAITLSGTADTSSGSPLYIDIIATSSPWLRVVYTKTSGTGTLNGYLTAKGT